MPKGTKQIDQKIRTTTVSVARTTIQVHGTPVVLAVLDGWGLAPSGSSNAIRQANTPNLENLQRRFPHTKLLAHGRYVGLLPDQEGNSEAGHSNIGAGRVVRQDILYVTEAIKDHTFFKNLAFQQAIDHTRKRKNSTIHIIGLLSNGNSAHASPDHLYALLKLMHDQGLEKVRLHLFTDGRDSTPHSAPRLLHRLEENLFDGQIIATIMGRFYGMDRNKWWSRTKHAYDAVVLGEGLIAQDANSAILSGYNRGETDEFLLPTVIVDAQNKPTGLVQDGDSVIFFNLRSDRARQLAKTFVQPDFSKKNDGAFKRRRVPHDLVFVAMTDFGPDLDSILTAFPSRDVTQGLTEVLGRHRLRQFYIAESEKYAHVTYFFNGGYADVRFDEERMRVPSLFLPHHYLQPKMRASVIVNEVIKRLKNHQHDFIALNLANVDMVAHSGNMPATIQAVEEVDKCIGKLAKAVLALNGTLAIVGDHGNAENMLNKKTGEMITEHSINPVPFILVNETFKQTKLGGGMLADVAPTILDIMNILKPTEMTGFSLIRQH
ncbi:2,3-bisphosphoglycerate-independent phosphoglycerate mutase [Patescibacteria group bacterium]|nr:2,3-bisphosphoglycerate-independent phosphoglycerate mutase [Patescibacteria group bacterium]MBU1029405.1 2,3-bisphosphoglycerate-independent phosphoglycerate mutase [Patescibacteria group bacterium]MBU1916471.1 2,3-bisphosphoglycerate-independent phosphoglycerate mutase [Patescibacteria group bacterium]